MKDDDKNKFCLQLAIDSEFSSRICQSIYDVIKGTVGAVCAILRN
jgi:hypothetical protein